MFTVEGLLAIHGWTHQCYQPLLEHLSVFSREEMLKPLPGFGWPTVHSQVMHIAETESFWITSARGERFTSWHEADPWYVYDGFDSVDEIIARYQATAAATREFFNSLSAGELLLPRRVEWSNGDGIDITPAKMLIHVCTHGFHHKGQVAAMSRVLGYPPPETDLA